MIGNVRRTPGQRAPDSAHNHDPEHSRFRRLRQSDHEPGDYHKILRTAEASRNCCAARTRGDVTLTRCQDGKHARGE